MNKKFIALAVAGILAAPMAAQAEATLYGKFHVGIDSLSNTIYNPGAPGNVQDISGIHITSDASRIGVKGSEDLGGGLSAIYQMEAGVSLTNDANGHTGSNIAGRMSYLGLAGGWGAVLVGNLDSALKSINKDPFADTVADNNNVLGQLGEDLRASHAVAYATPNFSGVSAVIAYAPDQQKNAGTTANTYTAAANDTKQDAWTGNLSYNNGPIYAAYGFLTKKDAGGVASGDDLMVSRVVGKYDFGNGLALGGTYDWYNLKNVNKRNNWVVNGTYTMGNNEFMAEYGQVGKNKDATTNTNDGAKMWALGIQNHMSKATSIYALYGTMDNDSDTNAFSMGQASSVTQATGVTSNGAKSSAFAIGMVHSF